MCQYLLVPAEAQRTAVLHMHMLMNYIVKYIVTFYFSENEVIGKTKDSKLSWFTLKQCQCSDSLMFLKVEILLFHLKEEVYPSHPY